MNILLHVFSCSSLSHSKCLSIHPSPSVRLSIHEPFIGSFVIPVEEPHYLNYICLIIIYINTYTTPWTVAQQAPPSMGFSRQEYWSALPFPSPGDLPDPGTEPRSPALQAYALTSEPPGKPKYIYTHMYFIYLYRYMCSFTTSLDIWLHKSSHFALL